MNAVHSIEDHEGIERLVARAMDSYFSNYGRHQVDKLTAAMRLLGRPEEEIEAQVEFLHRAIERSAPEVELQIREAITDYFTGSKQFTKH
ncbi:MAG: hypothetical protein KF748_01155 [Xanthobacteraceae bacterium]|nr:hypothetical protein [Xanthobacteraceae bacterium]MBX3547740.1 hypothetical protein [Xanthobacteraceae bacterium]